jgi:alpha-galactosidase
MRQNHRRRMTAGLMALGLMALGPCSPVHAEEAPRLVIPPPDPLPAIHGPRVVGATPGRPFLFLIPVTGDRPMTYAASNLPPGLTLDPATGILFGSLQSADTTLVKVTATNAKGAQTRVLTIIGGEHRLALTPPMGWNTWYSFGGEMDDRRIRGVADAFIAQGLSQHGYQYIGLDDGWEGARDASGHIQANGKFPDMKGLADYLHARGLKFGIYSSPGPKTCAGNEGSYQHEDKDAATYAAWGVDLLKYDWCSYETLAGPNASVEALQKPYAVMRAALDKVPRDMVFSMCQYGKGDVWKWGQQIGGNFWRTNGDLQDSWAELKRTFEAENGHEKYAGPGHWNDPDFLSVGYFNWGTIHPTRLTLNEQITQFSLWCLLAAPLGIGGDVTRLDQFTLGLLSNDEAIEVDQDPLGQAAGMKRKDGNREIWTRPLSDGTCAVGLVNVDEQALTITVRWSDLDLFGPQKVRDLWLHRDVGTFADSYAVEVPAHGCVLLKIGSPPK